MEPDAILSYLRYRADIANHSVPSAVNEIEGLPPGPTIRYLSDGKVELLEFEDDVNQKEPATQTMSELLLERLGNHLTDEPEPEKKKDVTLEEIRANYKGFDPFQSHMQYDDPEKPQHERLTYTDAREVVRTGFQTCSGIGQNLISTFNQFTEQFLQDFFARIVIVYVPNVFGGSGGAKKLSTRHRITFRDVRYFCLPKHFENNSDGSVGKGKIEDFQVGMLTNGKDNYMVPTPIYCQRTGKTYSVPLYVDIEHEVTHYENLVPVEIRSQIYPDKQICDIPIPVGSKYCVYNQPYLYPDIKELKEDVEHILPGYFIVFGKKKSFTFQERRAYNISLIKNRSTKGNSKKPRIFYHLEIRCENKSAPLKKVFNFQLDYKCNFNGKITCEAFMGHMKGVPLPLIFRAFGVADDVGIYNLVCPDVYKNVLAAQSRGERTNTVPHYDVFELLHKIVQISKIQEDGMRQKVKNYLVTRAIVVKAQAEQQQRKELAEANGVEFSEPLIRVPPEETEAQLLESEALFLIASSGNANDSIANDDIGLLDTEATLEKSNEYTKEKEKKRKREDDEGAVETPPTEPESKRGTAPVPVFHAFNQNRRAFNGRVSHAKRLLESSLFGHYDTTHAHMPDILKEKLFFLGFLARRLLDCVLGYREPDNIDSMKYKRMDGADLLKIPFTIAFRQCRIDLYKELVESVSDNREPKLDSFKIWSNKKISAVLSKNISTGDFTPDGKSAADNKQTGVTMPRNNEFMLDVIADSAKLKIGIPPNTKLIDHRLFNSTTVDIKCTTEYPEGATTGSVSHLTPLTIISIEAEPHGFLAVALHYGKKLSAVEDPIEFFSSFKIFINGAIKAVVAPSKVTALLEHYWRLRRSMDLNFQASIERNDEELSVHIFTDGGRCLRPVFIVNPGNRLAITKRRINQMRKRVEPRFDDNWFTLLYEGLIEYIGGDNNNVLIAYTPMEVVQEGKKDPMDVTRKDYTHCLIHPGLQFGYIASKIPDANKNPSTRGVFGCGHIKHAFGSPCSNYRLIPDNSTTLMYPQKPMVDTGFSDVYNLTELPHGFNAVVAIITESHCEEDAIKVKKDALERGMAQQIERRTERYSCKSGNSYSETFGLPELDRTFGITAENVNKFNHLDEDGIIKVGTRVKKGDIVVAKSSLIYDNDVDAVAENTFSSEKKKIYYNRSETYTKDDTAQVESVSFQGNNVVEITYVSKKSPEVGDKFSTRHGQKGVCGMIAQSIDLPFDPNTGIIPDIIINVHGFISRMSVSQVLESLFGQAAAHEGGIWNATTFEGDNLEAAVAILKKNGFSGTGKKHMICGVTGLPIEAQIFEGVVYYEALKHVVRNKKYAKAVGPVNIMTQQPPEGRKKDGNLKNGEQERFAMMAYGASKVLNEVTERSDAYYCYICNGCKQRGYYDYNEKLAKCSLGCEDTLFSRVMLPFGGFKLIDGFLQAMGMTVEYDCKAI